MKSKQYELHIDIYRGVLNPQSLTFVTEDAGKCKLSFKILEDRITPYDLSGCKVRMVIAGQQQDCTVTDATGGVCEIILLQSMFSQGGNYRAELQVYDSVDQTLRLTTPTFLYSVRKSLMDDSTVEADPAYSILQEMISNVNNADQVARLALETSDGALEKAEQAIITIDGEITKVNKAVVDANEALDRAGDVATREELNQKIMIGGIPNETNFNLVGNKVVRDGLVGSVFDNKPSELIINRSSKYTVQFTGKFNIIHQICSGIFGIFNKALNSSYYYLDSDIANSTTTRVRAGEEVFSNTSIVSNIYDIYEKVSNLTFLIDEERESLTVILNDKINTLPYKLRPQEDTVKLFLLKTGITKSEFVGECNGLVVYNRLLSPQEIQHNFSVLNNSQSISGVETTDKDGNTKQYKFSTDTDHVQDRTGRTQEEINREVYRDSCKLFESVDGGDITINNPKNGYLLECEVLGRTIKNIASTNDIEYTITENATIVSTLTSCEANKIYTLSFFAHDVVGNPKMVCSFDQAWGGEFVPTGGFIVKNGFNQVIVSQSKLTPSKNGLILKMLIGNPSIKVKNVMLLDGNLIGRISSYIPFGLTSTVASFTNNGIKQTFYHQMIEGKTSVLNGKLVSLEPTDATLPVLGSTPSVTDTIDIATKEIVLNTKEIMNNGDGWSDLSGQYAILNLSDMLATSISSNLYVVGHDGITTRINQKQLLYTYKSGENLTTFKSELQSNPIIFRYQLAEPIKYTLTSKELKAYEEYKKPILLPSSEDKLILNDNGSLTWVDSSKKEVFNGSEGWAKAENFFYISKNYYKAGAILNNLSPKEVPSTTSRIAGCGQVANVFRYCPVDTSIDTVEKLKNNLSINNLVCMGFREIPTTSHIPKEVNPPIRTYRTDDKINICKAGDAVKPSSWSILAPVNLNAEILARLSAVEALLNTPSNLSLSYNYVEDEYNKNLQEERML